MLRKYQNELMVLIALFLLMGAVGFKVYQKQKLESESSKSMQFIAKIQDIATMNKIWKKNKTVSQKLSSLKKSLHKERIEEFQLDKKKAHIILKNLNGTELNKVVGKQLASIPIQITELSITRSGEKYRLETRCKW